MDYKKTYELWLSKADDQTKEELLAVKNDENEIISRFKNHLEFGTAGLRGIMGAGINRMNKYTVGAATQGLANYINSFNSQKENTVAIACDNRNNSDLFSKEAASVLAANGIKCYIFDELRPTPELSFAIRHLGCISGINITASHNPKEYNGYKVYWDDGAQLSEEIANKVLEQIEKTDLFEDVKTVDFNEAVSIGKIVIIGKEIDELFIAAVLSQNINKDAIKAADFKIVYTPFHGTGYKLVPEVLRRAGFKNVICEPQQMVLDGNFSTVKSPNPENPEGFYLAIELAEKEGAHLIIGTDPDADRMAALSKKDGKFTPITGNQMGALMLDYIIKAGELPKNPFAVKSIVTTNLANEICRKNNVDCYDVFTGFKYIGEKIKELYDSGSHSFLFAYEESYGYLASAYVRDKDAVGACNLACEMAAYYHTQGKSLFDALEEIYKKYGYFAEEVVNINYSGVDAKEKMQAVMSSIRQNTPQILGGQKITEFTDYLAEKVYKDGKSFDTNMDKSNVLKFGRHDASAVVIRPSGTEPKIKIYYLIKGSDEKDCQNKINDFKNDFSKMC